MSSGSFARRLSTLYGTSLLASFGHGMTIPTIPILAEEFDVSIGAAAQVVTLYGLGRVVATMPAGFVVDKLGARVAMLLGPVLVVVAALSVVLAPSFWMVLLAMFVAGAGDSTWSMGREITGIEMVRLEQRGRLMSGFTGINSMGMALGPALGGVLTEFVGYQMVFLGYMAAGLAVLALSLITPVAPMGQRGPASANRQQNQDPPVSVPQRLRRLARSPAAIPGLVREIEPRLRTTYLALVFATFTMMLYRMTLQSMLPLYVVSHRGFSPSELGFILSVQGLAVMVMIVPAGFITDKLGRKWATVPSTGIPAFSFILIPFTDSLGGLMVLAALLGFAAGLSVGSMATSTYDVIPAASRARLQALRRAVSGTGGIGGPAIGGYIANVANPGVPFLAAAPLLVLASLLLLFVAKETLVKRPRSMTEAR